ncbi:MAG TPA: sigma 54-interacting transcriptional regulator [Thermodesulfobacteriota bacterium]|nr:sigma 54-interacting transcriptional regulator [Thermodesulfobacteriota bacterium]
MGISVINRELGRRVSEAQAADLAPHLQDDYRTLCEKSLAGIYVIQRGRFSYVNPWLCNTLGYASPDELIGKSLWEVIHPDDRGRISLSIEGDRTPGNGDWPIVRVIKKDGTFLWVRLEGSSTIYQGEPASIGHLINLTPYKQIEKSLRESLERYQTIVNEVQDSVAEVDLKGNLTFVNKANCRNYGYSREEELIGINYRSYMDEETAKFVYQAFNKVFRTGIPGKNIVYEVIARDGRRRTVEDSVSLIRNADGKITGFRTVSRDITDRKVAERELAEHRSRLEAIFRSVRDAIITVDPELRVIEANKSTEAICGIAVKEIAGKTFSQCLNRCSKSCSEVLRLTLEKKMTIKEYRVECGHQQRHQQAVSVSSSPLLDPEGKFMGAVLVIRDITLLRDLERELRERHQFQNLIGRSKKMQETYRLLEDLANLETTVLITGESGTGKDLVARALHYSGQRAFKPFVTVNCSALAENLLESELFGHVKGAFTGAIKDKQGRFQAANGGTILLDEIGDISPLIQLKLLRALQEKEFERVGESIPQRVDVRVVACTNKDLKEKVRKGEFRQDLYYRLKVVEVSLPPLRERLEDLPLLVDHFCQSFNERFKKNIEGISREVLGRLMNYPWPGNVRELEHVMEHAFVLCHGGMITLEHLPSEIRDYGKTEKIAVQEPFTHGSNGAQEVLNALNKTHWNKTKAARLLGIHLVNISCIGERECFSGLRNGDLG